MVIIRNLNLMTLTFNPGHVSETEHFSGKNGALR